MNSFWGRAGIEWRSAFRDKYFRNAFMGGLFVLAIMLSCLAPFYHYIENRTGVVLHDWILNWIAPTNVSVPIFIIIWGAFVLGIYRSMHDPKVLLNYIYAYMFFLLTRSICLVFVPLDPPVGLVDLVDPITNIFYGGKSITKDLFYSGHTCSVVMLYLISTKRTDKIVLFVSILILAVLLLFQHIHYSIDILAAPIFAVVCHFLGQTVLARIHSIVKN